MTSVMSGAPSFGRFDDAGLARDRARETGAEGDLADFDICSDQIASAYAIASEENSILSELAESAIGWASSPSVESSISSPK